MWRYCYQHLIRLILFFFILYLVSILPLLFQWHHLQLQSFRPSSSSSSISYPRVPWKSNEFECLQWIETNEKGQPTGRKKECWQRIRGGESGYCQVQNRTSKQVFHVMTTRASSLKENVRFTCRLAQGFTNFRHLARHYQHDPPLTIPMETRDGIIMTIYPAVLVSAYASIRRLRSIGCTLPIELWFRHDELEINHILIESLVVSCAPLTLRIIYDERITGFYTKLHALYYSSFTHVLLLDADNFAVSDPTHLFHSRPFQTHGAVFWPDFWHPENTIFNLHEHSLVWELLDLSFQSMMEQESGQVLIDRTRHRVALECLMFLATHVPRLIRKLELVWGDKDLFRFAWMMTHSSFYYLQHRLPGAIGLMHQERQRFCGLSMIQYDLTGRKMQFIHRNTIKLNGKDQRLWMMIQEYPLNGILPKIQSYHGHKWFNTTSCFGITRFIQAITRGDVEMKIIPMTIRLLEMEIIEYAQEALNLLIRL